MRWYEAAGIGVVLGCLYGLTLWASMDALALASFVLYGNKYKLPIATTGTSILIAFGCLFSYKLWTPKIEQILISSIENKMEQDDDEG
jgi:hypothetical protein